MLKVMLVDDEPLALEGLSLMIDWKKEGFEVCGFASSGLKALELAGLANPDLIVTDINMQGMNGLSLMAALRNGGYEGSLVVVSGYSDFEYAKKAMRYGVAGYLLKPIDPSEASSVLEHVRRELIGRELTHKLPNAAYHQTVTALLSGLPVKHREFMNGVWQLVTWGMPLPYDDVTAILDSFMGSGIQATTHIVDGREWLVLNAKEAPGKKVLDELSQKLMHYGRTPLISSPTESADALKDLLKSLCERLNGFENELVSRTQALSNAVSLLKREEFHRLADELKSFCELRSSLAKSQAYDLFFTLLSQQLAGDPDKHRKLLNEPARDIKALGDMAIQLLTPTPFRLSDQVKDYLKKHYCKQVTLYSVSQALGYNATYLGRVFREETGMGFRDCLNVLRMEKAARLLKESQASVRSVAESVGYQQYRQFLFHFKQFNGQTPNEFRKSVSP